MTDPTLPRRPFTPLPPQTGTLRAIRVEARRRRWHRLQLAGATGTTTLLVMAALVLVNRGTTVGLEPVNPPSIVESTAPAVAPELVRSPGPAAPPPAVAVVGGSTGRADAAAQTKAGSSAAPAVSATPGIARPTPSPVTVDDGRSTRPPITRSERDPGVQAPCTAGTEVPAWCLAATVDSGNGGERSTLQLAICPTDRTAERTLAFGRSIETRFVVSQGGRTVWSSDDGRSVAQRHVITVTTGRCVVWSVEWDQTDERGELVDPGAYQLTATSYADEVAGAPTSTASFTVAGG